MRILWLVFYAFQCAFLSLCGWGLLRKNKKISLKYQNSNLFFISFFAVFFLDKATQNKYLKNDDHAL